MKKTVSALLCLAGLLSAAGGAPDVSFNGYFKAYPFYRSIGKNAAFAVEDTTWMSVNSRTRINLGLRRDWVRAKISWELHGTAAGINISDNPLNVQRTQAYRITDGTWQIFPFDGGSPVQSAVYHTLDSLCVTLDINEGTLSFGRQSFGWGSATFINPTDIITPFVFNAVDKEERPGVDGIVYRRSLGMLNELESGVIFGKNFAARRSAAFVRARFITNHFGDISPVLMLFQGNTLLGLDLERNLGGATLTAEGAWVFTDLLETWPRGEDYFRLSTDVKYKFPFGLNATAEYHFSSAGIAGPYEVARVQQLQESVPYREGALYLLGRQYAGLLGAYEFTPLLHGQISIFANLGEESVSTDLALDYTLASNEAVTLTGGASLGAGGRAPRPGILREFGSAGKSIYAGLRWYF
ncbi:MAG: hypothetical protein ACQEQV_03460 [Fibrobacterota bacterium]